MKIIIISLLGIFFLGETFAQEKKTFIGIDLSSTVRSSYGNEPHDNVMAFGYGAGLTFQYKLKTRLSIISGLGYEKKGDITEVTFRDAEGMFIGISQNRSNYNYMTMPVLASFSNRKGNLYVAGGPYLGYLLSRIDKINAIGPYSASNINRTEYSKRIDMGLTLEFGYKIKLGNRMNMDIGIRENLGLLNTAKGHFKVKNNSVGLRVGVSYGL